MRSITILLFTIREKKQGKNLIGRWYFPIPTFVSIYNNSNNIVYFETEAFLNMASYGVGGTRKKGSAE